MKKVINIKSQDDNKCNRCGLCCHIKTDKGFTKCKFLLTVNHVKTHCRIYMNRLGTVLGNNHVCMPRQYSNYDYEGCPYNKNDGRPVIYKDENGKVRMRMENGKETKV